MTHKIINTRDYLLIVDDSQITVDDWAYNPFGDCPISVEDTEDDMLYINSEYSKIIAHLPLNNSPILEGVPLLPPLEDKVEQIAQEYFDAYEEGEHKDGLLTGFYHGHKKAKEKYKYTEEDLIKLLEWVKTDDYRYFSRTGTSQELLGQVIQSFQQPKMPVGFQFKLQKDCPFDFTSRCTMDRCDCKSKIKTTINSQGITQWVGEYIY